MTSSPTTTAATAPDPVRLREAPGYDERLDGVVAKICAGHRLEVDDGRLLYETSDIWPLGALADLVRRRSHGDVAYYNVNRHINYTNLCALSCSFCGF